MLATYLSCTNTTSSLQALQRGLQSRPAGVDESIAGRMWVKGGAHALVSRRLVPTKRRSADAQPQVAPLSRSRLTRSPVPRPASMSPLAPVPGLRGGARWDMLRKRIAKSCWRAAALQSSTSVREWRGVLLPEFVKLGLRNGLTLELRILIDL
jgi:hypothetical protein